MKRCSGSCLGVPSVGPLFFHLPPDQTTLQLYPESQSKSVGECPVQNFSNGSPRPPATRSLNPIPHPLPKLGGASPPSSSSGGGGGAAAGCAGYSRGGRGAGGRMAEVRGTWSATERRWQTRHREASPGRGSPAGRARRRGREPQLRSPPSIWSHRPQPLQAASVSRGAQGPANVIGTVWDSPARTNKLRVRPGRAVSVPVSPRASGKWLCFVPCTSSAAGPAAPAPAAGIRFGSGARTARAGAECRPRPAPATRSSDRRPGPRR